MEAVATESFRVLKKDKFCAILMGDTRKKGCVIPMSFEVMKIFEHAGFTTKEIIIKNSTTAKPQATGKPTA
jgi:DNA modification methylase